jgi:hypothetical protein
MNGVQVVKAALESTKGLLGMYIGDFTDADLLVRPVPGANHTAWQLGHVIAGDVFLIKEEIPDAAYPDLPAGFVELHSGKQTNHDGPGFLTKDEYLKLFNAVRAATIDTVGKLTDADLDRPCVGKMKAFAPTLGDLFLMTANHTLMHAGQFTVVRRKLGKPVLF